MNYAQIRRYDISNGPGVRATLFVSGCTHSCKGCFNKDYQDFEYGKEFADNDITEFILMTEDPKITGVNILGGEPLQQTKDLTLPTLLAGIKEKTNKPIWLWTGYIYENIVNNSDIQSILKHIDVLIDGKFIEDKKDLNLKYRGSSNQRVIDMNKTRELEYVVELENLTL